MHLFAVTTSSLQLIKHCFLLGVLIPISSAKDYWEAGVKKHNEYRAGHNTPPLELDSGLAEKADKCAEYYSGIGGIDHSCPFKNGAGENLGWSSGMNLDGPEAVKSTIKRWYDEIKDYDFNEHKSKGGVTGHFTQVVWKDSKKLGMGFLKKGKQIYVVGLYDPPGNYPDSHKENVLPPSSAGVQKGHGTTCLAIFMFVVLGPGSGVK